MNKTTHLLYLRPKLFYPSSLIRTLDGSATDADAVSAFDSALAEYKPVKWTSKYERRVTPREQRVYEKLVLK